MNPDLISRTLAQHATTVDERGPDLDVLHSRIAVARRRRHGSVAITASAAVVAMVAVGSQLLGGAEAPQPAPGPTLPSEPIGSELPFRADTVEVEVPDSARENASRMQFVERHENNTGSPSLEFDVTVEADRVSDTYFCEGGEPGLWLVVRTSSGTSGAVRCGTPDDAGWDQTMPFNRYYASNTSNLSPRVPHHIRMFVTTTNGEKAGPRQLARGMPEATDARFGMTIRGQTSPTVATLLGYEVSVLGEDDGRDWWFARGLEAPTGAESLTVELPASEKDRVVQTVVHYDFEADELPYAQLWLDGKKVDHRFDEPRIAFLDETTAFVPAGGAHTIELRVTRGVPENADFGVAIFEAD